MNNDLINNYPIGPFPVVIIGTMADEKPNFMTVASVGGVCIKPVCCLSITLHKKHYTTKGIIEYGYFSINVPSNDIIIAMDYIGIVSGRNVDKSKIFDIFYDDNKIVPLISECLINHICKVVKVIEIYDNIIFYGELLETYASKDILTNGKPDTEKINAPMLLNSDYICVGKKIGQAYQDGKKYKIIK